MIDEIKNMCEGVRAKGWLPPAATGNGAAGHTFEYHVIGRLGDNDSTADYKGYEFKTQLDSSNARVTLFTKSPTGIDMKSLWERYGKVGAGGKKRLTQSIKPSGGTFTFKAAGDLLHVLPTDAYYDMNEVVESINAKLNNVVLANVEQNDGKYRFPSFTIYQSVAADKFINLLMGGKIVCEFRVSAFPDGSKWKDRGTAFRISQKYIPELYGEVIQF